MPSTRPPAFLQLFGWLLAHVALGATIWLASPGAETVWFHVGRWLTGVQDADSWKPIEMARASAASGHPSVYDDVFFGRREKFQYPLTAVTLVGWARRPLLNVITWTATLATAFACAALARRAWRRLGADTGPRSIRIATDLLVIVAALSFYPVMKAYSLGQVQAVVTAASAGMLLAWQAGRKTVAGVLLGATLLLKPAQAPVLLWGAVRSEWRFVAAAVVTGIAGLLVSILQFPVRAQLEYVRVLSFIGQRGEVFSANQSLNGLLNRWVTPGRSLQWDPHAFAAPHRFVALLTTIAFVALIAAALFLVPRRSRGTPIDLACVVVAATIASPIAWEHHYGVLAPVLAVSWPAVSTARAAGAFTLPLLGAAALVAANYFQVTNRFDATWLNPLQSYLFFAGTAVFLLLLQTTRQQDA